MSTNTSTTTFFIVLVTSFLGQYPNWCLSGLRAVVSSWSCSDCPENLRWISGCHGPWSIPSPAWRRQSRQVLMKCPAVRIWHGQVHPKADPSGGRRGIGNERLSGRGLRFRDGTVCKRGRQVLCNSVCVWTLTRQPPSLHSRLTCGFWSLSLQWSGDHSV